MFLKTFCLILQFFKMSIADTVLADITTKTNFIYSLIEQIL